jgi:Ca-activated chloride channel homolog
MLRAVFIGGLLSAACVSAGLRWADVQQSAYAAQDSAGFTLRMPADEVSLSFHAADSHGLPVNDLKQEELTLLDNGKPPRSILAFYSLENHPIHAGILMDTSESMAPSLAAGKTVALKYVQRLFRQQTDQAFVTAFGYSREKLQLRSGDSSALAAGIRKVVAGKQNPPAGTALFDAVYSACFYDFGKADSEASGNFILLFTDGEDNASQASIDEVVQVCQHSNTSIYAFRPGMGAGSLSTGPRKLNQLAELTGGRVFLLDDSEDAINSDLALIEADLRNQYRLVYKAAEWKHDGSFHRIALHVPERVSSVVIRSGYYAPVR